jgi:hypothetical protein
MKHISVGGHIFLKPIVYTLEGGGEGVGGGGEDKEKEEGEEKEDEEKPHALIHL